MAAGNIKIQSNDTRIYTLTLEDGAGSNVYLTIPKDGGKLATEAYVTAAVPVTSDATSSVIREFIRANNG